MSGVPGVPPGTPGSPSTPGDGNPDQWLGILPPWVGQVSNLAGLGVDFGGASLDVLDNFEILAASKVASGAAGGLGLVFGALGVVEGSTRSQAASRRATVGRSVTERSPRGWGLPGS